LTSLKEASLAGYYYFYLLLAVAGNVPARTPEQTGKTMT
jgi:hypothetical protein